MKTGQLHSVTYLATYNIDFMERMLRRVPGHSGGSFVDHCNFQKVQPASSHQGWDVRYNVYKESSDYPPSGIYKDDDVIIFEDAYIGNITLLKHENPEDRTSITRVTLECFEEFDDTFRKIKREWDLFIKSDMEITRLVLSGREAAPSNSSATGQNTEWIVATNKPKRPNGQIHTRAMIWRDLKGWMKIGSVSPSPQECITELKKKPAYKNKKISTKRMQKILSEGFAGMYDDILKNI
ncbi:MAG TPA: hypothetical protein PLX14_12560 [Anaerolineales bacterium]|nr:hypothetical protein [Anaerolineales bacterium]HNE03000.1 hypothetical protein [Anaerolineales bacterium]